MSVVFFGASDLGFDCCTAIIEAGIEVKAIFTIPQNFSIKYKNVSEKVQVSNVLFKDFSFFHKKFKIPVISVESNIEEYKNYIFDLKPNLIVVIGWYFMIPESILTLPRSGSIAIHASLLPKYRGNAPLVWAMINGERKNRGKLILPGSGCG